VDGRAAVARPSFGSVQLRLAQDTFAKRLLVGAVQLAFAVNFISMKPGRTTRGFEQGVGALTRTAAFRELNFLCIRKFKLRV